VRERTEGREMGNEVKEEGRGERGESISASRIGKVKRWQP